MRSIFHYLGLKPWLISEALRGAEAPLFHGAACVREIVRSLRSRALSNPASYRFKGTRIQLIVS